MINKVKLIRFLDTGELPDAMVFDESLAEHDNHYHPNGYKEGDTCSKRSKMAKKDEYDTILRKSGIIPSNEQEKTAEKEYHDLKGYYKRENYFNDADRRSFNSVLTSIIATCDVAGSKVDAYRGGQISPKTLVALFAAHNSDPEVGFLFKLIFPVANKLGVEYYLDVTDDDYNAEGYEIGGRIALNLNNLNYGDKQDIASTIVHELIHGVTSYAIDAVRNNEDNGNEDIKISEGLRDAVRDLQCLRKEASLRLLAFKKANEDDEFLAYLLSDVKNRNKLKRKGLFSCLGEGIWNVIREIKGEKKIEKDLYKKAVAVLIKFLENYDVSAFADFQNELLPTQDEWVDSGTGNIAWKGKKKIDRFGYLTPKQVKKIIAYNVSFIKTMDYSKLPKLEKRLKWYLDGRYTRGDLQDWLEDSCDLTEAQAKLIVKDQINKMWEGIKIERWKKMGIRFVMWKHGGASDPRDYHKRDWDGVSGTRDGHPNGLNGFIFPIDDPPVINEGSLQRGYPGSMIGCSCKLVAVKEK